MISCIETLFKVRVILILVYQGFSIQSFIQGLVYTGLFGVWFRQVYSGFGLDRFHGVFLCVF